MDRGYERGWHKYSFEEIQMREITSHGGDIQIRAATPLRRGPGELMMSLVELPPHEKGNAIGLHVHRDFPTGTDVEEIFIILAGHGIMTFSNGDQADLSPGDAVTTYPGTAHALRVTGDKTMRLVAVLPHAYRTDGPPAPTDPLPHSFTPRIQVTSCHARTMAPLEALCNDCGSSWLSATNNRSADNLPQWANTHPCVKQS